VAIERRGVELRENEDAPDVGVQAVTDRNVDQTVLAADGDGRLRAMLRQRKEARALAASENERQHAVVHGHVKCTNRTPPAILPANVRLLRICPDVSSISRPCHTAPLALRSFCF
jgi:hypothetical protein